MDSPLQRGLRCNDRVDRVGHGPFGRGRQAAATAGQSDRPTTHALDGNPPPLAFEPSGRSARGEHRCAESGERDPIFPIEASREAFNRVKKVYEVYGAAGNVEQEIFDDRHAFFGRRGLPFLARHLGA